MSEEQITPEPKKCGCGETKNPDGFCDGSHQNIKSVCPEAIADQPVCGEEPLIKPTETNG